MKNYIGSWHIKEMSEWDADYFNMEVQAFIQINDDMRGEFQFGLVVADLEGCISGNRFEFTWEGNDELDSVSGSGWLELENNRKLKGQIKIHNGDISTLIAERT